MHDDELKKAYQAQSTEQPSQALDKAILAEAQAELEQADERTRWAGWRPRFATAASVAVVVLLAVQFRPLYWDTSDEAGQNATSRAPEQLAEPEINESNSPIKPARLEEKAIAPEPATMNTMSADFADRQATMEKQRRKQQPKASAEVAVEQLATAQNEDLEMLRMIQQHLKDGEIDAARQKWLIIRTKYPETPESEPLKSLYLGLKPAFE